MPDNGAILALGTITGVAAPRTYGLWFQRGAWSSDTAYDSGDLVAYARVDVFAWAVSPKRDFSCREGVWARRTSDILS